jgi:hypothetical protein
MLAKARCPVAACRWYKVRRAQIGRSSGGALRIEDQLAIRRELWTETSPDKQYGLTAQIVAM